MNEEVELSRADLLALIDAIGGHGAPLDDVETDMLEAILRNRLQLVSDAARIEKVLRDHKTLPLDVRAMLVMRLHEIDNAKRAVANALAGRPHVVGGLEVVIPHDIPTSTFLGLNGRVVVARLDEHGRRILDLLRSEWTTLAMSAEAPKWIEVNLEIHRNLGMVHNAPAVPTVNRGF
jgi:hypothetical protein